MREMEREGKRERMRERWRDRPPSVPLRVDDRVVWVQTGQADRPIDRAGFN